MGTCKIRNCLCLSEKKNLHISEKKAPYCIHNDIQILMSWKAPLAVEMKWDHSKVQLLENYVAVTCNDCLTEQLVQKVAAIRGTAMENCFA